MRGKDLSRRDFRRDFLGVAGSSLEPARQAKAAERC